MFLGYIETVKDTEISCSSLALFTCRTEHKYEYLKIICNSNKCSDFKGRDDVHRLVSFDYKTKTKYSLVKGVNIVEILEILLRTY